TPSWNSLEPVVLHLDAIKDMNIPPHGKRTFDKHGKEHNNLHWHVRIQGVDSLGKKFKKDVKVYNCDPRYAEADETMPDDEDTNPNHATTTTTTEPGGTTTTTAPGGTTTTTEPGGTTTTTAPGGTTTTTAPGGTTTTTEPDADTCVSPDQMFANIR